MHLAFIDIQYKFTKDINEKNIYPVYSGKIFALQFYSHPKKSATSFQSLQKN